MSLPSEGLESVVVSASSSLQHPTVPESCRAKVGSAGDGGMGFRGEGMEPLTRSPGTLYTAGGVMVQRGPARAPHYPFPPVIHFSVGD